MFCTNCGKAVSDEISFCPECGAKIKRQASGDSNYNSSGSSNKTYTDHSNEIDKSVFEYKKVNTPKQGMKWHYTLIVFLTLQSVLGFLRELDYFQYNDGWLNIALIANWIVELYIAYCLLYKKKNAAKYVVYYLVFDLVLMIFSFDIIFIVITVCVLIYTRKYYQVRENMFTN